VTFPRSIRHDEGSDETRSGTRGDRNVVALLTEMFMLPVTAFLYGMELLVRVLQSTQTVTEQSMHVMVGPGRLRTSEAGDDGELRGAGNGGQRASSGNDGDPEPRPAQKEAAAMDTPIGYESRRDRDLRDDTLKLVRYKILFVKREYEVAFPEEEDLVYDNMDGTSFAAWKVAEFIQKMNHPGVCQPPRWEGKSYPKNPEDKDYPKYFHRQGLLKSLPEDDKKYLRVYYEVLDRYPREKFRHDEQHIDVLRQIRDELSKKPSRDRSADTGDEHAQTAACEPASGTPRSASPAEGGTPAAGSPPGAGGTAWQVRGI
jgi:hypothetical protein